MWYVYIVECGDGTFYIGITTNVEHRVAVHNKGKGAKYTRARLPVKLLFAQPIGSRSRAASMELYLKKFDHAGKAQWAKDQKWRNSEVATTRIPKSKDEPEPDYYEGRFQCPACEGKRTRLFDPLGTYEWIFSCECGHAFVKNSVEIFLTE